MTDNQHIGSSFDEFLDDNGLLEDATSSAIKRVIAWQVGEAMKATGTKKSALAAKMKTSRTVVDRILDEGDIGLTLDTISRTAIALGYRIDIRLVPAIGAFYSVGGPPASGRSPFLAKNE